MIVILMTDEPMVVEGYLATNTAWPAGFDLQEDFVYGTGTLSGQYNRRDNPDMFVPVDLRRRNAKLNHNLVLCATDEQAQFVASALAVQNPTKYIYKATINGATRVTPGTPETCDVGAEGEFIPC